MNHSMPGLPVHHQLLEFTKTHIHRVSDAIQPTPQFKSINSSVLSFLYVFTYMLLLLLLSRFSRVRLYATP